MGRLINNSYLFKYYVRQKKASDKISLAFFMFNAFYDNYRLLLPAQLLL